MGLVSELQRRSVFRVAIAYVIIAWLILQVGDTLAPALYLAEWVNTVLAFFLILGFPLAVFLAWAYELTPEGIKAEKRVDRATSETHITGRKLDFLIIAALSLALVYFAFDKFMLDPARDAKVTSSTVAGLAEVRELVGDGRYAEAFARARELESSITDDALGEELWNAVSVAMNLISDPPGADVWVRPYNSAAADWQHLGKTPVTSARMPLGTSRIRMELDGYRPVYAARGHHGRNKMFKLDLANELPEGMIRVPGADFDILIPGLQHLSIELPDFLIDEFEITNNQYKKFVDAGGYTRPEFWDHPFARDNEQLSFDEAMELFRDKTGRPGPSTWELGRFLDGMENHPVAGVSWFEAAAYAKFVNKQLPTVYHWYRAASPGFSHVMLALSNFDGKDTVPVGTRDAISSCGALDMAGNVREWIWNQSENSRLLLGGGWSDPEYMFTDANAQSPFDRSNINGIRLMISPDDSNLQQAQESVETPRRDYWAEQPVSDEIFDIYERSYAYDSMPMNAEIVAREDVGKWTREKIEIDAAYGNERLTLYLFLPQNAKAPYRPIVYFPGAGAIFRSKFASADEFEFSFLIRSGYAVLFPVYKGTFERRSKFSIQNESNSYREHVIQWSKDLGRSLDYLETRADVVMAELGYFSLSWGSAMAPIMIAMEPRIRAGVLISGGLYLQPTQPEVDPFHFLPRVSIPTLMVNIPNDFFFPLETSQKPFYQLLGSEAKEHVLIDGGHIPPMNPVARQTLDWYERNLGTSP